VLVEENERGRGQDLSNRGSFKCEIRVLLSNLSIVQAASSIEDEVPSTTAEISVLASPLDGPRVASMAASLNPSRVKLLEIRMAEIFFFFSAFSTLYPLSKGFGRKEVLSENETECDIFADAGFDAETESLLFESAFEDKGNMVGKAAAASEPLVPLD